MLTEAKMEEDHEKFVPKIQQQVNGTYYVTLRKEVVEAAGWKVGDQLKIVAKKIQTQDAQTE
jgi:bifunctional DNA-binding transcriptional regulator/antitoxin component of YhaV-PrlF toxin-antitoxin module